VSRLHAPGFADLRIAVVSPFVDRHHGTERAIAELLERLANFYHCEIHLYAQRVEGLSLGDSGAARPENAGIIVWHKVPVLWGPHVGQFLGWMVWNGMLRWWHFRFRGVKFDRVLSPGINCLDADVIIVHALFHRLRELSREENADTQAKPGFFRGFHRSVYYGLLTRLERRIYSNKNVSLATVSQRSADLLKRYFGRQDVRVIPNGVDTREFSPSARLGHRTEARLKRNFRDSELVLLFIGNDWRVKGLPAVLKAMAATPGLPLHLLVVGDDLRGPYQEMAKSLGILERCRWESTCSDVVDLYAAADVYVSPSLEDSFGMPVAEAMACGLPVITSVFAGVSGLMRNEVDGFVLEDPRDTQALQVLLERLYSDKTLRQQIGASAGKTVQDWTWDGNAAAVWELLKEAAADDGKTQV
jgi:glycosyltransferase involved in cell wall biosynthesis